MVMGNEVPVKYILSKQYLVDIVAVVESMVQRIHQVEVGRHRHLAVNLDSHPCSYHHQAVVAVVGLHRELAGRGHPPVVETALWVEVGSVAALHRLLAGREHHQAGSGAGAGAALHSHHQAVVAVVGLHRELAGRGHSPVVAGRRHLVVETDLRVGTVAALHRHLAGRHQQLHQVVQLEQKKKENIAIIVIIIIIIVVTTNNFRLNLTFFLAFVGLLPDGGVVGALLPGGCWLAGGCCCPCCCGWYC